MQVTSVRAVPVAVPLTAPFRSALGEFRRSEYGIVILETDTGHRGLGEISLIWHGNGGRLCSLVTEILAPLLVGSDPFQVTRFLHAAREALSFGKHSLTAVAAVEMALLDLQGRILGQPIYNLLGGLARDRVPLSMSLPVAPVEQVLSAAGRLVERGFTTLKVKSCGDAAHDVDVVRRLRGDLGPALGIRIDLNMACRDAKQAIRLIRRLEEYDILSVEQPLPPHALDGLALIRSRCDVPLLLDESVWSIEDAWSAIDRGAADLVNVYVAEAGGISAACRIADLCAATGVGVAVGSMPELGIGTAAAGHLAFSVARLDHPSDVAGSLYHAHDIVAPEPAIVDGALLPSEAPGLGVELDEERLQTFETTVGG